MSTVMLTVKELIGDIKNEPHKDLSDSKPAGLSENKDRPGNQNTGKGVGKIFERTPVQSNMKMLGSDEIHGGIGYMTVKEMGGLLGIKKTDYY